MYGLLNRMALGLATGLALAGGAVLLCLIVLTCVSIIGRVFVPLDIGIGPIRGIYDMTEIAMAAAIFAFLPWAHLTEANARVDLLEPVLPGPVNSALDLVFNIAMLVLAVVGTWRLYLGMLDKMAFREVTLIAQIPVWQGYAAALAGGIGFVIIAGFCVLRALRRAAGIAG